MSDQFSEANTVVSTVTPVFRGRETLVELTRRLLSVGDSWAAAGAPMRLGEILLVDDGSTDGSAEVLDQLELEHDLVRVISLSRNYGQHPATSAGILHASGDWIVTLDEDLQHEPEDIERLLGRAVAGSEDVVYAAPSGHVHRAAYRDLASRGYKRFLAWATNNPSVREFNSFRMMRGSIARAAAAVSAHDTFLDVALTWFTNRIASVPLGLRDSRQGTSSYSVRRLISHARRALVSSQTKWLRIGALLGLLSLVCAVVLMVWLVVQRLLAPDFVQVQGWTSTMIAVTFFGGLLSCLVGVLLEYVSTLVLGAHGKPTFFVVDRRRDAELRPYFGK